MYGANEKETLSEALFKTVEEICLSVDATTRGRTKPILKEA
jgi:guanylate kinase